MKAKTRLALALVALVVLAALLKIAANSAALSATGFRRDRGESVQEYFDTCIRRGAQPQQVAQCMPKGASVDRFISRTVDNDSVLLERYTYRAYAIGSWPVQIYYDRGGGVVDSYAQDSWPSINKARPVNASEAYQWWRSGLPNSIRP